MCIIFQVDISVIVYMPVCLPSLGHNFKGNHEIYGKYADEPSKSVWLWLWRKKILANERPVYTVIDQL